MPTSRARESKLKAGPDTQRQAVRSTPSLTPREVILLRRGAVPLIFYNGVLKRRFAALQRFRRGESLTHLSHFQLFRVNVTRAHTLNQKTREIRQMRQEIFT